ALRGKSWLRLGRSLYCWRETARDPWKYLGALQRLMPEVVFSGRTAAWIHGMRDIHPVDPIEVIVPPASGRRSQRGLYVRRAKLGPNELTELRHLRVTSVHRTLTDLCFRLQGVEALILLDSALHSRVTDLSSFPHPLARLAEPAESPMETRLRWLLVQAGLPRPQVQVTLPGLRVRADLLYADCLLVIEFDGGNHRERLVDDNRRQNLLISAGYTVLRFTASDLYNRPETIVAQVSGAVAASARPRAAALR
ncbi:MAG TPA: DUF559 domain-containing protein, partial [Candidatus Dormibacteraeota bacterium]|nr:DUF559 domain-containing protein [Candidatus Dormibacteraeota bacterium]